jgi:Fe-S cluster assembly scaffold protein SufB
VNAITPSGGKVNDDDNEKGVAIHPRLLCVAHDESQLSFIQSNVDLREDSDESHYPTFVNGYTQIFVGTNANVTHCYLEESGGVVTSRVEMSEDELNALSKKMTAESAATFVANPREVESQRPGLKNTHFQSIDVHIAGEDGSFSSSLMQLGGTGRSRIAISTTLLRPGASSTINGFALSGGAQRSDMRTNIHHIAQGSISKQDQRNMVGGRSTASFRGRIRVEQSAQQMDSEQLSRTILLSDHARIWATPSLEIIADDVKCSHGATVSDLSEEELFYLRSRGLDVVTARNLLMYAFVEDIARNVDKAIAGGFDDENGLRSRIVRRLQAIVPEGQKEFVGGEFQSV